MLKKLLKYDFKALFRIWWFAAAASVLISIAGGFGSRLFFSERDLPVAVQMVSLIIFMVGIFASCVLALMTFVLVFSRFYRNFFSDEGYLTFTLPVSRMTLLNSKVICGTGAMLAAIVVCCINVLIMLTVGNAKDFFEGFRELWYSLVEGCGYYLIGHIILSLLLVVLVTVCSVLFLYACVTFAAMVVRKAKLFAAIGIYYAANSVISFGVQMFYLFGSSALGYWLSKLSTQDQNLVILLMLLAACLTTAIVSAVLYISQLAMLEKKLNLN